MASRKEQKEQARLDREAKEKEHAAAQNRSRRLTIIGGVFGLALVAVIVAVVVSTSTSGTTSSASDADAVNARFQGIPQRGPELGEKNAPATIVEFADLKCPFCKEFTEGALPDLIENYVKSGKAKIIYRNLTFLDQSTGNQDSTNAAKYNGAMGLQNKLWQFTDLFYLNQKDESTTFATQGFLEGLAKQVDGADPAKAWTNRDDKSIEAQLALADEQFSREGLTGTPSFLVGPTGGKLQQVTLSDLSDASPITDAVDALQ